MKKKILVPLLQAGIIFGITLSAEAQNSAQPVSMILLRVEYNEGRQYIVSPKGFKAAIPGTGIAKDAQEVAVYQDPKKNFWYIDKHGQPTKVDPKVLQSVMEQLAGEEEARQIQTANSTQPLLPAAMPMAAAINTAPAAVPMAVPLAAPLAANNVAVNNVAANMAPADMPMAARIRNMMAARGYAAGVSPVGNMPTTAATGSNMAPANMPMAAAIRNMMAERGYGAEGNPPANMPTPGAMNNAPPNMQNMQMASVIKNIMAAKGYGSPATPPANTQPAQQTTIIQEPAQNNNGSLAGAAGTAMSGAALATSIAALAESGSTTAGVYGVPYGHPLYADGHGYYYNHNGARAVVAPTVNNQKYFDQWAKQGTWENRANWAKDMHPTAANAAATDARHNAFDRGAHRRFGRRR